MKLQDALDNFILDKELAYLSPKTISSYKWQIQPFIRFVGSGTLLKGLTYDHVKKYIMYINKRNDITRTTKSTYIRCLRIFLTWVSNTSHDELSFNPKDIKIPKTEKKIVHMYSDSEIVKIFENIESNIPWIECRNRLIIALMLDSGIRQDEVCKLLKKDISFEKNTFKVNGKGAKERIVPIGSYSRKLLKEYICICPSNDSDYLFIDRYKKTLSGNAIRLFVHRMQDKLGFELSSHKLRHNFATNFCIDNLRECGNSNIYDLSILLGHESIETTKRYEHFAHEIIASERNISHLDKVTNL